MPQDRRAPVLPKSLRIVLLEAAIVLCFAVYVYRLFSMQVLLSDTYRTQSRTVSSQVSRIPAQRGEIFDRNATVPMVINTDSFAVEITPAEIPAGYYDTVASRLAQYLGVSKFDIDKRIPEKLRKSYTAITVRSNVSFETISNIAENKIDLPGVSWVSRPIRNYVETGSLSHIIGYVGDITQEEINVLYNQGYTRNSVVGKTGIERQYDQLLQGTSGIESRTVDVRGRILSDKPDIRPPQPGKNLVLTIDSRIQTLAEKTLGNRVGAVVVLKPAMGEILALVSYPYFDPNIFNSDDYAQEFVKLRDSPEKPLLNRAVAAQYPPGSTFKIIMVSALLQEKSFSPFEKIECKGKLVYGNRTFHCHVHEPGHGWLDLKNALAQSCDVYFWTIGRDYLGIDKIAQYSTIFGLGKSAEIDLPNQVSGFIPTAQWKERKYHERWLGGDTMSASIGQGYILATPLQVADMMAMVCNEGVIYKPHLLKEVRNPVTNEVITEVKPEVLFKSDIPSDVWKTVQEDCRYTITDGTPQYPMRNRFVQSAGKTGTSEVAQYKNSWHSWMVAYAPYDAPVEDQVVVSTLVEAVNPWEWWSPYATNIIIQGIFANQTYEEAVNALGFHYLLANGNRQE
ncbi:penicillin-binding protein 2 [Treponema sp. SP13]|uniref:penicillin-binding protein 2 n=1 Tax=Treponema sp. SP13 TaxID=2789742 RepID=UPI003D92E50A